MALLRLGLARFGCALTAYLTRFALFTAFALIGPGVFARLATRAFHSIRSTAQFEAVAFDRLTLPATLLTAPALWTSEGWALIRAAGELSPATPGAGSASLPTTGAAPHGSAATPHERTALRTAWPAALAALHIRRPARSWASFGAAPGAATHPRTGRPAERLAPSKWPAGSAMHRPTPPLRERCALCVRPARLSASKTILATPRAAALVGARSATAVVVHVPTHALSDALAELVAPLGGHLGEAIAQVFAGLRRKTALLPFAMAVTVLTGLRPALAVVLLALLRAALRTGHTRARHAPRHDHQYTVQSHVRLLFRSASLTARVARHNARRATALPIVSR